jgi:hypothetical protein
VSDVSSVSVGPRAVVMPDDMPEPPTVPPPIPPMPPAPQPIQPDPALMPKDPPAAAVQASEAPRQEAQPQTDEPGPDAELWEGGPTLALINEWKQQYGEGSVFVTSLTPDYHVVWRTLTRFEYRRLVKNLEQAVSSGTMSQAEANLNNEESITELCCLFPTFTRQNGQGVMAGLPSVISQEVMEASGFVAQEVRQL